MSDATAFIKARFDEDERVARAALEAAPEPWERRYDEDGDDRWLDIGAVDGTAVIDTETGANGPPIEVAEHFYRHRPARVLAEVESKRRILREHDEEPCSVCIDDINGCPTRRAFALPYAGHPDYDPAWRNI